MKRAWWMVLVAIAGCYRSVPVAGVAPGVGGEVVVDLTAAGAVQLAPQLGAQLQSVRGRVAEVSESALVLAVTATSDRSGSESLWKGERAVIPRAMIDQVSERRIDRKRTWIVVLVTLVAVVVAGGILGGAGGFDGFVGGGGGGRQ